MLVEKRKTRRGAFIWLTGSLETEVGFFGRVLGGTRRSHIGGHHQNDHNLEVSGHDKQLNPWTKDFCSEGESIPPSFINGGFNGSTQNGLKYGSLRIENYHIFVKDVFTD